MAATTFASMAFPAHLSQQSQQSQCIDPNDLENFVDFGAMPSPGESSKAPMSHAESTMTSPTNTVLPLDYDEAPIAPSHEYGRYKQTTGLPTGSYLTGISEAGSSNGFDFSGYNTGLDGDLGEGSSSMFMGSNTGLGLDTDMDFDMGSSSSGALPAYFFPTGNSQASNFIDPSAINSQEEQPKVRYYPGVHQKQAAMAKAQAQAQQQRQQQMMQQQQQQQHSQQQQKQQAEQPAGRSARKSATPIDARTEETIARVVNQIRQNSSFASDATSPTDSASLARMKKDEEDMDEDERLLNSEEGKKLSSKERRQLRNKVSARAFRSRRKEYIGQLEGDLATRANEMQDLRNTNRALMEENARFRELTVKLLRHPAFTPFLEDISRDPALSDSLSKVSTSMNNTAAAVTESKPQQVEAPQQQDLTVGMTTIPETQLDFSALNLNGNTWGMPNGFGSYQPQIFAVTELPEGPTTPLDVVVKGEESIIERFNSVDDTKPDVPELERHAAVPAQAATEPVEIDESDPTMTLYANTPRSAAPASPKAEVTEPIFGSIAPEKVFERIELIVTDGRDATALEQRLAALCARADAPFLRLQTMSAVFE